MIREASIQAVSTRTIDELVCVPGMSGIPKSEVSRLCAEIDERMGAVLDSPIDSDCPNQRMDATYVNVRKTDRIVSMAVTIAVAVRADAVRERADPDQDRVRARRARRRDRPVATGGRSTAREVCQEDGRGRSRSARARGHHPSLTHDSLLTVNRMRAAARRLCGNGTGSTLS